MHRIFSDAYLIHHIALLAAAASQFEVVHALLCTFRNYYNLVQLEALEQLQAACIRKKPLCAYVYTAKLPNDWIHSLFDQPAVEYKNGSKLWCKHSALHRDNDLPAVEWANGDKEWHKNGKLHRDNDLPALEQANGDKAYYKHGEEYTPGHLNT